MVSTHQRHHEEEGVIGAAAPTQPTVPGLDPEIRVST